jgi:enoyl-CoA hydratase
LHALNLEMCEILGRALLEWERDRGVDFVLIDHQEGTRGFCAGGDIRMLAASGAGDGAAARAFFHEEYRVNHLLKTFRKPVIALMDGVTMGGGVGISVHGAFRVATPNTVLAMPEAGIGLFPDVGGGWFLPRLAPGLGTWLALTGVRLKGRDVLAAGLATHFVEAGGVAALNADLVARGPEALSGLEVEARGSFEDHIGVIADAFSQGEVAGVLARLAAQDTDWARAQADMIGTRSPTTMAIALEQLKRGAQLTDFADNMAMEYRIGARLVHTHDFQEGVRAVIIEKDNTPRWNPASVGEVRREAVEACFAPLPDGQEWTPYPGRMPT